MDLMDQSFKLGVAECEEEIIYILCDAFEALRVIAFKRVENDKTNRNYLLDHPIINNNDVNRWNFYS